MFLFPFLEDEEFDVAPFPNRLTSEDINMIIVRHMTSHMDFRLSDVIRFVTGNIPTSSTATYQLLEKRLRRLKRETSIKVDENNTNAKDSSRRTKRVQLFFIS